MKENIKTVLLTFLLGVTILLASLVWMRLPPETDQILDPEKEQADISQELQDRFFPRKAIINFGHGDHTVVHRLDNIWPFYANLLKESFSKQEDRLGAWKEISQEEYFFLHQQPSVAFNLGNQVYSHLFMETFYLKKDGLDMGEEVYQVYFSTNAAFVALATDKGYYEHELSDISSQGMEKYVNNLRSQTNYTPYKSLHELYGLQSLVYLPQGPIRGASQESYKNDLADLDPAYESDLVQRFLSQSVESVHVIEEEGSTLYVSGQKTLRIDSKGFIEYRNSVEKKDGRSNLTRSIDEATKFITQKTGIAKDFYFDRITSINQKDKEVYRLEVNYMENSLPVVPLEGKKPYSYIIIDMVDDSVESFVYLYRSLSEDKSPGEPKGQLLGLEEVLSQNLGQLDLKIGMPGGDLVQVLGKIKDVNLCLVDRIGARSGPLLQAYEVEFADKKIYFSALTGEILMER